MQPIIENSAYLYDRDRFIPRKGTAGHLVLKANELQFTPSDGTSQEINIPLGNITDADFTQILAKAQFIISTSDGQKYVFGFVTPKSFATGVALGALRPLNGLWGLLGSASNVMMAKPWKSAFAQATPQVFRTRKEIQIKNLLLGTILGIIVLAAFFAGLIFLLSS